MKKYCKRCYLDFSKEMLEQTEHSSIDECLQLLIKKVSELELTQERGEYIREIYPPEMSAMIKWLEDPNGSHTPTKSLNFDAVEGGGILVRLRTKEPLVWRGYRVNSNKK